MIGEEILDVIDAGKLPENILGMEIVPPSIIKADTTNVLA